MWRKTLLFYKNVPTKKFHLCESSTYVKSITLNLMGKKNVPDKKFHLTECSTYVSSTYVKSTVSPNSLHISSTIFKSFLLTEIWDKSLMNFTYSQHISPLNLFKEEESCAVLGWVWDGQLRGIWRFWCRFGERYLPFWLGAGCIVYSNTGEIAKFWSLLA